MYNEAKWMNQYAGRYRGAIIYFIALGVMGTLMGLAASVSSKYLIDAVTFRNTQGIKIIIPVIGAMALGGIAVNAVTTRISAKINVRVNNEIQADVYDRIMDTDWESMAEYHSGDLLNRLNGDVNNVSGSILGWIPSLIIGIVQFAGSLAIIVYYDPTMAVLSLLSAPVTIIVSRALVGSMRKFNKKMREVSSTLMAFNEESFQNVQPIKAFDLVSFFSERLRTIQNNYAEVNLDFNKFSIVTSVFMSIVGLVVSYSTFGWAVYRLWGGHITFGTMTLFLQLSGSLSGSFSSLVKLVPSAISAATSAGRIMAVVELPRETKNDDVQTVYSSDNPAGLSIELSNVYFNYRGSGVVLDNISIHAAPGEIVALVGPSGEGKTTIIRILLGLLNITSGSAVIRDYNAKKADISAGTRKFFAYVPQDKSIFSGTVAENMRMVKPHATDEEIREALKTACAYEFVEKMHDEINSRIGERGSGLSEGQGQRLSIARAILRNSPILLLDEATSALDVATERKVLRNIMSSGSARTCIVTTHRPSVLSMCHRVYRINKAKIEEVYKEEVEKIIMEF